MHVLQAGLMHMLMSVFGSIGVEVGVLVLHVLMLVCGVCVRVDHVPVPVFVGVRSVVGVLVGHRCHLLMRITLRRQVIHPALN